MIIKAQHWLAPYIGYKLAYSVVYVIYCLLTAIPIFVVGYLFDSIVFMIILMCIVNFTRKFTFGFHLTNGKCIYFTLCMISIFSYFQKNIPLVYSFFIALWCMRDIYLQSPLKLTVEDKSKKWHEDRILLILAVCLGLSAIGLYFNWYTFTSGIVYSIIMIDLTLFLNKNEQKHKTERV